MTVICRQNEAYVVACPIEDRGCVTRLEQAQDYSCMSFVVPVHFGQTWVCLRILSNEEFKLHVPFHQGSP
jgi:hypothetical protein